MAEDPPISPGQGDPHDPSRPVPGAEDLRIPQQVRRSWALEDLDYL